MMALTDWCTSCPVVLPRRARSVVWRHPIGSPGSIVVPCEWSTGLTWYCSRLSARLAGIKCAAYLHVLQAHDVSDVRRLVNMHVCLGNT
jgi:hypothetical protein